MAGMRTFLFAALLPLAVLATTAALAAQTPNHPVPTEKPMPAPAVGAPAPQFRLNDHAGHAVAVGGVRTDGKWTVVAFYPKAATPG